MAPEKRVRGIIRGKRCSGVEIQYRGDEDVNYCIWSYS